MSKSEEIVIIDEIKNSIERNLNDIIAGSQKILRELGNSESCLLCELDEINGRFQMIQSSASTFYLQVYLSAYTESFHALASAMQNLSNKHHGGLIIVERGEPVAPFIRNGVHVQAELSASLAESIFYPGNPLHDGAMLVKGDKIVSAANVLPLSEISSGGSKLGTRHRAALGLTERTDAVVLIVSEETGKMSFAKDGTIYPISTNNL
ncbi:sporulation-specific diadenylate cyclase CdaS [Metabacillus sp. KIGAM252]|uniref:Diadenylate cyclase n=1 Tax=Metabacillus flavus TaxID=2823519 RepID=A0ABS5LF83_9BACI|nr:sporulation-specific diadenylate cyclase CdaS [Metabacillus flavus]MBS2969248.1 sporulation-specific diadenylate cyclase CdaS [Metabacillus flavus]